MAKNATREKIRGTTDEIDTNKNSNFLFIYFHLHDWFEDDHQFSFAIETYV